MTGQPAGGPPPGRSAAPWTAEIAVTPALAGRLIARQFPRLSAAPVEPLAAGWDNTVYRVGGDWVFRFPRRAIALAGVGREMAVLPAVAALLPLPVPVPELKGSPGRGYPWPFWGARLLPGTELADARLPDAARGPAAAAAGGFLRALHAPATVAAARSALKAAQLAPGPAAAGLPADPMHRADPAARAQRAAQVLDRLAARGVWVPDREVTALLARAAAAGQRTPPPADGDPQPDGQALPGGHAPGGSAQPDSGVPAAGAAVLAHGDLHIRHLLVDAAGRAAGVIDWGDLCTADPAVDLSLGYGAFAGQARERFLAAYGPVDAARELRARTLAVSLCANLAEYAADDDRPVLLGESLAGLRRAVSG